MTIDPNNIPANYIDMVSLGNYGYTILMPITIMYTMWDFPAEYWVYRLESVEEPRNIPGYNLLVQFIVDMLMTQPKLSVLVRILNGRSMKPI